MGRFDCGPPVAYRVFSVAVSVSVLVAAGCFHARRAAPLPAEAPAAPRAEPAAAGERPRDAFVLLSGGGTPITNNYSQYVQARAVAAYFERACAPESRWVFFGAGNRPGTPPALADVRRESRRDGVLLQSWLPGVLPENRPATRESFLRALREEILPAVRGGGTLYLFVGDHGELAGPRDGRESAITLWQLKRGRRGREGRWYTDEKEVLGVAELRQVLAAGLGAGRVVFCMTQCHSGGFHQLGLPGEIAPPRAWFASPPAGAGAGGPVWRLRVAGFTATDQASPAAGCDPDPDPERWAGYERFLPEALFGVDLLSGGPKGRAHDTLAAAHEAATLNDHTIDKPRATSEHYLAAWADAIETHVATTLRATPEAWEAVAAYRQTLDTGVPRRGGEELQARAAQFARFTEGLVAQLPDAGELLRRGTRAQLEAAVAARPDGARRGGRRGAMAELRRAWTQTLRPAWKSAVVAGRVPELLGAERAFERELLEREEDGPSLLLSRDPASPALLNAMYWSAGYGDLARFEAEAAAAITRWGADRRNRIVAWGRRSADAAVRAAAEKIGPGPTFEPMPPRPLSRTTAAERVLFYRRVLAAWEFLIAMDAAPALRELEEIIALEQSPLPR